MDHLNVMLMITQFWLIIVSTGAAMGLMEMKTVHMEMAHEILEKCLKALFIFPIKKDFDTILMERMIYVMHRAIQEAEVYGGYLYSNIVQPVHKISKFHLISSFDNFVKTFIFHKVSEKFPHQKIRSNSGILHSVNTNGNGNDVQCQRHQ